jgi:hypothetical protein
VLLARTTALRQKPPVAASPIGRLSDARSDDGKANVVLIERVEERLLALHLRKIVEIAVPPEDFE